MAEPTKPLHEYRNRPMIHAPGGSTSSGTQPAQQPQVKTEAPAAGTPVHTQHSPPRMHQHNPVGHNVTHPMSSRKYMTPAKAQHKSGAPSAEEPGAANELHWSLMTAATYRTHHYPIVMPAGRPAADSTRCGHAYTRFRLTLHLPRTASTTPIPDT